MFLMRAWQGGGAVQGEAGGRQGATGVCRDLSRSELWEGGAAVEGVLDPGPWLPHLFSTGSSSTQNERLRFSRHGVFADDQKGPAHLGSGCFSLVTSVFV